MMFGVQEVVQKVHGSLGIASVRSELPADIPRQPVATANLPHHIQLASLVNWTTSVFILDQKTVAFIPMGRIHHSVFWPIIGSGCEGMWPWHGL